MNVRSRLIHIGYAALVAATSMLLTACKPDPPIPSVAPATAPGSGTASASPAAARATEAPVADPRKDMSEADTDLAGRIESALNAETSLHGSRIGVRAADGVVTLTGSTRTPNLRSMASQIALSVEGVRLVRNELAVAMET